MVAQSNKRWGRGPSEAWQLPIAFVKYYEKGSTAMGGDQIAIGLHERGWDAHSIPIAELHAVPSPGILIFIKTSRLDHLVWAKARGHRLILDVQDTVVFKKQIKNRWLFDGMIFKNLRQVADFGRQRREDCLIYHQWDPRYRPNAAPSDRLALGYLGLRRSLALWGKLPGVEYVDEGYFEAASRFNCHLSIREPGREFLYKPNCKVSTAAACGANLISTRDLTTVELLGDDYPYFCDPDPRSVRETILRVSESFGSPEWRFGLERMARVREQTRLDLILDQYEQLLSRLGSTGYNKQ